MYSMLPFFCAIFAAVLSVQATLYVNDPVASTVCHGGQPCTVSWLDDGVQPLLSSIAACYVGMYNGNDVLVQEIEPVDVASVHSLVFTPDPAAGPDSTTYYINFTAVNPVNDTQYTEYSAFFTLEGMSGSFASPIPSDTATIPVPSTVLSPPPNPVITPSGSSNGSSSGLPSSPSGMSTSHSPSQSASPTPSSSSSSSSSLSSSSSPSPSASTSSAAGRFSLGSLAPFLAAGAALVCFSIL